MQRPLQRADQEGIDICRKAISQRTRQPQRDHAIDQPPPEFGEMGNHGHGGGICHRNNLITIPSPFGRGLGRGDGTALRSYAALFPLPGPLPEGEGDTAS